MELWNNVGSTTDNEKDAWCKKSGNAYYVRMYNKRMVSPHVVIPKSNLKWEKVNSQTYYTYLRYLRTSNERHLNNANRKMEQ